MRNSKTFQLHLGGSLSSRIEGVASATNELLTSLRKRQLDKKAWVRWNFALETLPPVDVDFVSIAARLTRFTLLRLEETEMSRDFALVERDVVRISRRVSNSCKFHFGQELQLELDK